MNTLSTSVVIVGAGPAGLTLAHLLGAEGVSVATQASRDSTDRPTKVYGSGCLPAPSAASTGPTTHAPTPAAQTKAVLPRTSGASQSYQEGGERKCTHEKS